MKKQLIIAGTVLTMTFGGLGIGAVTTDAAPASSIAENNSKISKVEQDIIKASLKVNEINLDIQILEGSINENAQEAKLVEAEIKLHKEEIEKINKEIDALEKKIEERSEVLKQRLASYQQSGDLSFNHYLFGTSSIEEVFNRAAAVSTITNADKKLVDDQVKDKAKVEKKEKEVVEKLEEEEKKEKDLKRAVRVQKTQKEELAEAKSSVQKEVRKLEDKKATYVEEGNNLRALEARVEQEIEATGTVAAQTTNDTQGTSERATARANNNVTNTSASSASSSNGNTSASSSSSSSSSSKSKNNVSAAPSAPSANSGGIIGTAKAQMGVKYKTAGTSPSGFDCSGFTTFVFKQNGINLPRTAASQASAYGMSKSGTPSAGDLVFFTSSPGGGSISHVGISLGGSKYIGSQTSTGVAVASINDPYYWGPRYAGYGKVR